MTAWLRHHTRRSGRDAAWSTKTALRLKMLPVTAGAYRDGVLSGGQIQAIVANLKDRTLGVFAHHQAELIPELAPLSVGEAAFAMQDWARRADALVGDPPEPGLPEGSLHLSRILERSEAPGPAPQPGGRLDDRHGGAPAEDPAHPRSGRAGRR